MHASLIGVDLAELRAEIAADLGRVRLMKITDPDEINAALKLVGDNGGCTATGAATSGDYINSEIRAGRMPRPHLAPPHYRRSMTSFATKTISLDDIQGVAIPEGATAAYEYLTSDAWLGRSCAGCSKPMDGSGHEYDLALVMHDAAGKTLDWHLTCWDDAPSEVRMANRESARVFQYRPVRMAWLYHSCTVCGWACVGCKCTKRGQCEHPSHDR